MSHSQVTEDVNSHKRLVMCARTADHKPRGKILAVVSSPIVSPVTGKRIGFYASELTHALWVFEEAGFEVEVASTQGGAVEMDEHSNPLQSEFAKHDMISRGYLESPSFREKLEKTQSIADVSHSDYAAIFLAGGQAPPTTFYKNKVLENLVAHFFVAGKPTAAVCHGTCVFLNARCSKGELLVRGRHWTGFSNDEEQFVEGLMGHKTQEVWIEREAQKLEGTHFVVEPAFQQHAILDGHLVTGQQQNSTTLTAQLVLEAMGLAKVNFLEFPKA